MVGNGNKKYILIFFGFFLPPSRPPEPNFYPKMPIFLKIFFKCFICDFFVSNESIYERKWIKKNSKINLTPKRVIFTPVYQKSLKKKPKNTVFYRLASDISNERPRAKEYKNYNQKLFF